MTKLAHLLAVPIAVIVLLFVFTRQAHAYLDPGSGSYIFQLLLAALVGALFAVRIYWKRIRTFFRRLLSKEKSAKREDE
jgi:drug/metabolite transporter (DMT)-like permease